MPPLYEAILSASLTIGFFTFYHAKVGKPWLRDTLIIAATLILLGLAGVLAGSPERSQLTGDFYAWLLVISYLAWRSVVRRRFGRKDTY